MAIDNSKASLTKNRQVMLVKNFDSVGNGSGMATVKIPSNRRIHRMDVFYANGTAQMTPTNVDGIFLQHRLKRGSKELRVWTPKIARTINATKGLAEYFGGTTSYKTAVYPIYFSEPQERTQVGEDATALQVYPAFGFNDDLILEIDLATSFGGSATTPTLYIRLEYDTLQNTAAQFVKVWKRGMYSVSGATQGVYTSIVKGTYYPRIHFFSDKITKIEVKKNNVTMYQFDTLDEYKSAMEAQGLTPVDNVWTLAADATNRIGDVIELSLVDTFEVYITTSAGADIEIVSEELRAISAI